MLEMLPAKFIQVAPYISYGLYAWKNIISNLYNIFKNSLQLN